MQASLALLRLRLLPSRKRSPQAKSLPLLALASSSPGRASARPSLAGKPARGSNLSETEKRTPYGVLFSVSERFEPRAGLPAREGRALARPGDEEASARSGSDLACGERLREGRSLSRNSASDACIARKSLLLRQKKGHRTVSFQSVEKRPSRGSEGGRFCEIGATKENKVK